MRQYQTPTCIGQQKHVQSKVSVLSREWRTNGPVAISFVGVNKIVDLAYPISAPL
jgi:hypothetical protein